MCNTNCLEGMECPSCGSFGGFSIVVTCFAYVTDDGAEDYASPSWDSDSICECGECGYDGHVKDFQ